MKKKTREKKKYQRIDNDRGRPSEKQEREREEKMMIRLKYGKKRERANLRKEQ